EIASLGQMLPRDIKAAAGGRQIEALDAFERERYRKAALDYAVLDTVAQRWDIDGLEALARSLNGELDIAPKAIADDLRDREKHERRRPDPPDLDADLAATLDGPRRDDSESLRRYRSLMAATAAPSAEETFRGSDTRAMRKKLSRNELRVFELMCRDDY